MLETNREAGLVGGRYDVFVGIKSKQNDKEDC